MHSARAARGRMHMPSRTALRRLSPCTDSLLRAPSSRWLSVPPELSSTTPWVRQAGEGAVLLRFGTSIDAEVNTRMLAYMATLDDAPALDGVREILPAYASLLVHFDPLTVSGGEVRSCPIAWHLRGVANIRQRSGALCCAAG